MKNNIGTLWKIFALGVVAMTAVPLIGQNTDISQVTVPSLDLDQADVRDAIRALFKNVGNLSFTIAPDVQGQITMSIKNKPFTTVLESILAQADATYRVEGSTYVIIRRPQQTQITNETNTGTIQGSSKVYASIKIQHADPLYIFTILTGSQGRGLPLAQIQLKPEPMIGGGGAGSTGGFGGGGGGGRGGSRGGTTG
ncbi:MAG: secretin and TonB N-terminal domain-containing protein [Armatimonadetes bacterium]|nr:secretin and TonB N-terminal domain-containing protein [Armatimonadota bacterium]